MKIYSTYYFFLSILTFLSFVYQPLKAQQDTIQELLQLKVDDMYAQFKDNLLNQQVTIASKRTESLFEAPFSASVITKEDIKRAGCTSVAEVFRLIPGLMVAEQSNGNFDMHVRGGGNVVRNTLFSVSANTTTLVMIDNRPIYNYYLGGTFWETIPIDLNDIERIELVRGPTSAMYGPNAVSGVINIVTRQAEDQGVYAVANVQQGTNNTFINNASLGYRFNKTWNVLASGNFQKRDRTQSTYYNYPLNQYVELASMVQPSALGNAYPHPNLAMQKYGVNAYINYQPSANTKINLAGGYQDSDVQKAYSENFATPLTTALSKSRYLDFRAKIQKLNAQLSYQNGTQDEGLGNLGQKWDFNTLDALVEYDINIQTFTIKPGFNFRKAVYDDTPYVDVAQKGGQFNGRREITTIAPFLRSDYSLFHDKLRLIAALRVDVFNYPDKPYLSYQFAVNYKVKEKHIFRLAYSRANASANIIYTYADRYLQDIFGAGTDLEVAGNKKLNLLTTDLAELGYRGRLADNLQLDTEIWYSQSKNFANFIYADTRNENGRTIQPFQTLNIPLKTQQFGITVALNYVTRNLQIRPYVTYQQTQLLNSSPFTNTAGALFSGNPSPITDNFLSNNGKKESHLGTPTWFGGLIFNYLARPFNFNLNPYFFTDYQYYSFQNPNYPDGRGIGKIPAKFILNAKISYYPITSLAFFINIRNAVNQQSNEFYNTDKIGMMILGGINFDF